MNPTEITTPRIAYIEAGWHKEIVGQARIAFLEELAEHHIPRGAVEVFEVPGSLEIPLQAKLLARSGKFDIIVACGLVIDGGIYRHEFVADAVISGLMRVGLDTEVPVLSAVLTPQHFHEHEQHQRFFSEHFVVKGEEAASACLRTLANIAQLKQAA